MPDKSKYDPQKHHRRSIRLKGYDYSQEGAYFITICVKDRACLFGKITNGEMHLNEAGLMVDKWWQKIPGKFPDIELAAYQIMPNHFHAVVINVGATPRGRPGNQIDPTTIPGRPDTQTVTTVLHDSPDTQTHTGALTDSDEILNVEMNAEQLMFGTILHEGDHVGNDAGNPGGDHVGSPLHHVVGWFKTMTTNDYIRNVKQNGWSPFNKKLWQRNYYEHIIRNDNSFQRIESYIYNNPRNWKADNFCKD